MIQKHFYRILPFLIIIYMVMAFVWWAILLYDRNDQLFQTRKELIELKTNESENLQKATFYKEQLKIFEENHYRQKFMIIGEAAVFTFTLMIGIWLIYNSSKVEMQAARQQRNFLLSITHELKSPIASIQLIFETFKKHNLDFNRIKNFSENGLSETKRLKELVNNLLLSARIEQNYHPNFSKIDLFKLINEVVDESKINFLNTSFFTHIENSIPNMIADEQGLKLVLSNLIGNAVKYNFKSQKSVWISLKKERNWAIIEVADDGIGIEEQEKSKVFQKFYRVGEENTRKTKGTGLGLFIVKEIIRLHKGKINIQDNRPEGTKFLIHLPIIE